ncbi:MAG TPA: hypothetical protein VHL98_02325 [Microvirga sp.]|jgi:hypothetical protein|nr:hypothetical protein [Microvirga sp.]
MMSESMHRAARPGVRAWLAGLLWTITAFMVLTGIVIAPLMS